VSHEAVQKEVTVYEKLAMLIDEKNLVMKRQLCDFEDPNMTDDEDDNKITKARISY
jgi:hypothetical protein